MSPEPKRHPKPKWVPLQESILARHPHLAAEADHERAAAMGLNFAHIAPGTKVPLPWWHPVADGRTHRWLQAGTSRVHMHAGCSICRGFLADRSTSLSARAPTWRRNGTRPSTAPASPTR